MKSKNKPPPWLRPKAPVTPPHVGVGWYTADEWVKVKASAIDAERFEESFAEWEAMAEESLSFIRAQGVDAQKSLIVASDLLAWCLAHGKQNDASARAEFVSYQDRKTRDGSA